jgi:hypothetical protein
MHAAQSSRSQRYRVSNLLAMIVSLHIIERESTMRNFSILFLTAIFLAACASPVATSQTTATQILSTSTSSPTETPAPTQTSTPTPEPTLVVQDRMMEDIQFIPESVMDMGESNGMRVTVATDESQGEYVRLNENWDANGLGLTPQESVIRHVEEIGWYDAGSKEVVQKV